MEEQRAKLMAEKESVDKEQSKVDLDKKEEYWGNDIHYYNFGDLYRKAGLSESRERMDSMRMAQKKPLKYLTRGVKKTYENALTAQPSRDYYIACVFKEGKSTIYVRDKINKQVLRGYPYTFEEQKEGIMKLVF